MNDLGKDCLDGLPFYCRHFNPLSVSEETHNSKGGTQDATARGAEEGECDLDSLYTL